MPRSRDNRAATSRGGPRHDLAQLAQPEHQAGDRGAPEPVPGAERDGAERALKDWHIHDCHLQDERQPNRNP